MNKQSALTFLCPLKSDDTAALKALLKEIEGKDVESNPWFPFLKMETVHFARLLVLDKVAGKNRKDYPPYLVFSTNYDGELDAHLKEVLEISGNGFFEVFGYCAGCPESGSSLEECISFIKKHSNYKAYFHRGTWRRTVKQIRTEEKARQLAEDYLDNCEIEDPKAIHAALIDDLKNKGAIDLKFDPIKLPKIGLATVIVFAAFFIFLIFSWFPWSLVIILSLLLIIVLLLRLHEMLEKEYQQTYSDVTATSRFTEKEDHIVQNQLTHLVEVKPGIFRRYMLKLVLWGIHQLAIFVYNKGKLGNIPTIHFARWVRIDKGRRLLFFSNYTGSWESYLGDFIDKAAAGLTGVWSNTRLFPKTKWLILDGARDEERFKAWTRDHQEYTDVWYSAYKNLSVKNILKNTEIYEGFHRTNMTEEETRQWLEKF